MRAAVLIATKDLKQRIRDRSAILIAIVAPFALAFIFNAILGGVAGGTGTTPLGYVDLDGGPVAQAFVQQVIGPINKGGQISFRSEATVANARSVVSSGTLNAVIVIPAGFSQAVQANAPVSMQVIGNVGSPISNEIARSIADGYAAELNRIRLSVATVAVRSTTPLGPDELTSIAARAAAAEAPVAVQDLSSKTKQLDFKTFYAAGMAVFFLFFTVQFGVMSLLEERNEGTMARLLAAPIARGSILLGKVLTSFLVGVISMTVLAVASSFLFGASWGNPIGVAILIVGAVLSATGVTALVASFSRDAEQAGNIQTIVSVVLGALGGTFFPVSQASGILSSLTFIAPQAWFLRGLGDLHGGDLSVVWVPTLAMLGFGAVTGAIALTRLRRIAEF
ncbi:MAG: ABC transporter permease [Candidatus Dormibacterales bacterium]